MIKKRPGPSPYEGDGEPQAHRYFPPKSSRGTKIIFAAIVIVVFGAFLRYFGAI